MFSLSGSLVGLEVNQARIHAHHHEESVTCLYHTVTELLLWIVLLGTYRIQICSKLRNTSSPWRPWWCVYIVVQTWNKKYSYMVCSYGILLQQWWISTWNYVVQYNAISSSIFYVTFSWPGILYPGVTHRLTLGYFRLGISLPFLSATSDWWTHAITYAMLVYGRIQVVGMTDYCICMICDWK